MKIIGLEAENFKRLKAVSINPDGTLQVIGGRNAQGKSSVMDAIWSALGGGKAAKETTLPIRDGEEKASVKLTLTDLVVTRSWTAKGTTLKVENADGATYKSPQGMLDALIGQLGFDPLAFTRLSAAKQREELLNLVELPIDLDELEAGRTELYEKRTEVGRQGKAIGDVEVDESLPEAEPSASDLIGKIQAANESNNLRIELIETRTYAKQAVEDARQALIDAEDTLAAAEKAADKAPELIDVDALRVELASVEEKAAKIRANNAAREQAKRKADLRTAYDALTGEIGKLDKQKADALGKAKFPVDGLGFDESGVTYQGIPLSQASSAEQIKVSVAMGMALNPKLKVLMIKDGSLLDEQSMAAIREQVAEHDFQLWIERVGNADQGAIIIEDGEVA